MWNLLRVSLRFARAVGVVTAGRFSATFMFAVFMAVVFVNSTTWLRPEGDFAMFVVELERPNASDTGRTLVQLSIRL